MELETLQTVRESALYLLHETGVWGKEMTLWVAGHTGAVSTLHASDPQY
jgi:hypothetical protein